MQRKGIIQSLIRERQPFAVLALLAFLLPGILAAAGLHASVGSFKLADGTTVICTDRGFVRVANPDARLGHAQSDCCETGCVHAVGAGLAGQPVTLAARAPFAIARVLGLDIESGHGASPAGPGAIRAPPARSV